MCNAVLQNRSGHFHLQNNFEFLNAIAIIRNFTKMLTEAIDHHRSSYQAGKVYLNSSIIYISISIFMCVFPVFRYSLYVKNKAFVSKYAAARHDLQYVLEAK